MLFRTFSLSIFLLLSACSDPLDDNQPPAPVEEASNAAPFRSSDVEETDFTCPHQQFREVFFTSRETKDKLDIQILGNDCDAARILMRILTPQGEVVHQTEARALDYTYEDVGAAGVERMLEYFLASQYFETALDDLNKLTEDNGYYELNQAAAMKAAKSNQPLFCHQAGKSFANCYAFVEGSSVFIFSSGS